MIKDNQIKSMSQKKSKSGFILFFLFVLGLGAYFLFSYHSAPQPDFTLLEPKIPKQTSQLTNNNKPSNNNNAQIELDAILASIKDPEKELPTPDVLPEFTPEEARPSRSLIKASFQDAEKILKDSKNMAEVLMESIPTFDLAFMFSQNPRYLEAILDSVASKKEFTLDEMLVLLSTIKNQKLSLQIMETTSYIKVLKCFLIDLMKETEAPMTPIQAIKMIKALILLPKGLNTDLIFAKIKPVLVAAMNHKNSTRSDGLFLNPEESTQFSLLLISVSWQYYLDHKPMPDWLFTLAEKETCRLAYRLEPDGSLPDWSGENKRNSLASEIYKASLIFDRDDLRFIGICGRRMQDAQPPIEKSFYFPEIGLAIIRTNWNIYHFSNPNQNKYLGLEQECFQITYDATIGKISIYAATAHFGIFTLAANKKNEIQNIKIIENSLLIDDMEFKFKWVDKLNETIEINNFQYTEFKPGKLYLVDGEKIKADDRMEYLSDWERYKQVWNAEIIKNDKVFRFNFKSFGRFKLFIR